MELEESLAALEDAIGALTISDNGSTVLMRLARDPHGILRDSASAIVAPMINSTIGDADRVIRELMGDDLLVVKTTEGLSWLVVNYRKLKIDKAARNHITSPLAQFEEIGQPHSPKGMSTLSELFLSDSEIYLVLSVTGHDVFTELTRRADQKKTTVFLFPDRRVVSNSLREHHQEVLNEWIRFLKSGNANLKRYTMLYLACVPYEDIYTSALAEDFARINIKHLSAKSSREGTIIRVNSGSSLYRLFSERLSDIYTSARPIFRLDPMKWCQHLLWKAAWPFILLTVGVLLAAFTNVFAAIGYAIVVGLLRNWISDSLAVKKWGKKEFFQS